MSDWAQNLIQNIIMAILGSASLAGGIGWFFKTRREDRKAEEARQENVRLALELRVEKLTEKVENLLRDAIAREREQIDHNRERMEMDAKQIEVISAATTALKEATIFMAKKTTKGPT